MSNETIVKIDTNETTNPVKKNSTRALTGKIARLPKDIREELNRRLEDGQPASEILPWVNGLPMVKEVMAKHFGGEPINDGNLSEWRQKGYQRWLEKQEAEAETRLWLEEAKDLGDATGGMLARGTANIIAAKILKMVQTMPAGQDSIDGLAKISYAISALLNAEQGQARLEYEKTRVELRDEEVTMKWDKQQRDGVAIAQRALDDALAKDIQATPMDNGNKIELLGYRLYGNKWQGRKVWIKEKAKEDPKKEPVKSTEPEKTEGQTADQQVRPTMVQGHNTEAAVSPTGEKAEVKEMDATPEQHMNRHSPRELEAHIPTKKQEDPSVPKPSPWDAFSEPVKPSLFASFRGTMRPSSLG